MMSKWFSEEGYSTSSAVTYRDIADLEFFVLYLTSAFRNGVDMANGLTGSIDCTNSLRMPPKKKHTTPVKMRGALRQNHIRLASL